MAVRQATVMPAGSPAGRHRWPLAGGGLVVGVVVVVACAAASLAYGETRIPLPAVVEALLQPDGSFEQTAVRTVRVPRTLAALLVGAALAVSGAILQGITRNVLASPQVLAVNAGVILAVVLAVAYLGIDQLVFYAWFSIAGGAAAAITVYSLAALGGNGPTPLKIVLAGAAMSIFLGALTATLLLLDERTLDEVRGWLVGSLAGRDMNLVAQAAPFMLVGLAGAFLLARQITTLTLGDEVAQGLGQDTTRVRALAAAIALLLAGGAVALAGPIGFVGLVVPNAVRLITGGDYRLVLPYSALGGAVLVTVADLVSRGVVREQLVTDTVPVGVITPIIGVPVFIMLVRGLVR